MLAIGLAVCTVCGALLSGEREPHDEPSGLYQPAVVLVSPPGATGGGNATYADAGVASATGTAFDASVAIAT
jgi:hypothetical protein